MEKRGLSTVVTTLIIILLSLVAIGIMWLTIQGTLKKSAEDLSTTDFGTSLSIKQASIVDNVLVKVNVERNAGGTNLQGIAIKVSNEKGESQVNISGKIDELGSKTIQFPLTISNPSKIEVYPVSLSSGKEKIGSVLDSLSLTETSSKKSESLVAYYPFEDGAKDASGNNNNGVITGTLNCNVEGKIGKACLFNGISDYIAIDDSNSLDMSQEITISVWFKLSKSLVNRQALVGKHFIEYELGVYPSGCIHTYTSNTIINGYTEGINLCVDGKPTFTETDWITNKWYHVAWTLNKNEEKLWINGVYLGSYNKINSGNGLGTLPGTHKLEIGRRASPNPEMYFSGTIDEVRVYNRSLSEEEIKAIYNQK
jgi:hypothetical protein